MADGEDRRARKEREWRARRAVAKLRAELVESPSGDDEESDESSVPERLPTGQKIDPLCHFMAAWDDHRHCYTCRKALNSGRACSKSDPCQVCVKWSEKKWTLFHQSRNRARRDAAKRARRAEALKAGLSAVSEMDTSPAASPVKQRKPASATAPPRKRKTRDDADSDGFSPEKPKKKHKKHKEAKTKSKKAKKELLPSEPSKTAASTARFENVLSRHDILFTKLFKELKEIKAVVVSAPAPAVRPEAPVAPAPVKRKASAKQAPAPGKPDWRPSGHRPGIPEPAPPKPRKQKVAKPSAVRPEVVGETPPTTRPGQSDSAPVTGTSEPPVLTRESPRKEVPAPVTDAGQPGSSQVSGTAEGLESTRTAFPSEPSEVCDREGSSTEGQQGAEAPAGAPAQVFTERLGFPLIPVFHEGVDAPQLVEETNRRLAEEAALASAAAMGSRVADTLAAASLPRRPLTTDVNTETLARALGPALTLEVPDPAMEVDTGDQSQLEVSSSELPYPGHTDGSAPSWADQSQCLLDSAPEDGIWALPRPLEPTAADRARDDATLYNEALTLDADDSSFELSSGDDTLLDDSDEEAAHQEERRKLREKRRRDKTLKAKAKVEAANAALQREAKPQTFEEHNRTVREILGDSLGPTPPITRQVQPVPLCRLPSAKPEPEGTALPFSPFVLRYYGQLDDTLKGAAQPGGPTTARAMKRGTVFPRPDDQGRWYQPTEAFTRQAPEVDTALLDLASNRPGEVDVPATAFRRLEEDARASVLGSSYLDVTMAAARRVLTQTISSTEVSEGIREWLREVDALLESSSKAAEHILRLSCTQEANLRLLHRDAYLEQLGDLSIPNHRLARSTPLFSSFLFGGSLDAWAKSLVEQRKDDEQRKVNQLASKALLQASKTAKGKQAKTQASATSGSSQKQKKANKPAGAGKKADSAKGKKKKKKKGGKDPKSKGQGS